MRKLLILLLLTTGAWAQSTTTVTGTIKDLSNAVVTSGQVTFDLRPAADTTVSGSARFTPSTVICTINGSGLIKALDGVSSCVVVQNTSLTPAGTYYKVCIQAYTVTPGSCFNWYALASSFDITTAVPTPGTSPAFTFLDLISAQSISGVKTFTGVPVFSAGISGTASQILALPNAADMLVGRATTDTLTNKTLTSPILTSPSTTGTDSGAETLTNKTLTSPVVNGSPTGTGIPTLTQKTGSGGGTYTGTNTSMADVDSTNLSYTVTIPTGWKLKVDAAFNAYQSTAAGGMQFALADGGVSLPGCVQDVTPSAINLNQPVALTSVITGDGASHTIRLRAITLAGADAWNISNASSTRTPSMTFILSPSN